VKETTSHSLSEMCLTCVQGDQLKGASSVGGNSGNGRRYWTAVGIRWYGCSIFAVISQRIGSLLQNYT